MTDIQKALLEVLYYLGFGYLAKDANGDVYAYESEPQRRLEDSWAPGWSRFEKIMDNSPLKNLVRWDGEALDIHRALGGESK
jgi:hypothetical protein